MQSTAEKRGGWELSSREAHELCAPELLPHGPPYLSVQHEYLISSAHGDDTVVRTEP